MPWYFESWFFFWLSQHNRSLKKKNKKSHENHKINKENQETLRTTNLTKTGQFYRAASFVMFALVFFNCFRVTKIDQLTPSHWKCCDMANIKREIQYFHIRSAQNSGNSIHSLNLTYLINVSFIKTAARSSRCDETPTRYFSFQYKHRRAEGVFKIKFYGRKFGTKSI